MADLDQLIKNVLLFVFLVGTYIIIIKNTVPCYYFTESVFRSVARKEISASGEQKFRTQFLFRPSLGLRDERSDMHSAEQEGLRRSVNCHAKKNISKILHSTAQRTRVCKPNGFDESNR